MNRQQYQKYIRSEEWRGVKRRYRASSLPQTCVVCGEPEVDLHHRTYARFGREKLTDLVPLCRQHHQEAHRIRQRFIQEGLKRKIQNPATAKQLAFIGRLGGTPSPEMTRKEARKMYERLMKQTHWRAPTRSRI